MSALLKETKQTSDDLSALIKKAAHHNNNKQGKSEFFVLKSSTEIELDEEYTPQKGDFGSVDVDPSDIENIMSAFYIISLMYNSEQATPQKDRSDESPSYHYLKRRALRQTSPRVFKI